MAAATARRRRASPVRYPLAEIRRLRAELAQLRRLTAELIAADPGPVVTIETARSWTAQARAGGYEDGYSAGFLAAVDEIKRERRGVVSDLVTELRRRHVCCRECRRFGCRPGCKRCEQRTLATLGQPHPDDYVPAVPGRTERRAS